MDTNFTPSQEELKVAIDNFLNESAPFFDALAKIESLKPKSFLLNMEKGYFKTLPSKDTAAELEIKKAIEYIKQKHLGKFN